MNPIIASCILLFRRVSRGPVVERHFPSTFVRISAENRAPQAERTLSLPRCNPLVPCNATGSAAAHPGARTVQGREAPQEKNVK